MSSDIFVFDEPFSHHQHHHSNSTPFPSEVLLLSDPLSALSDSSIDSLLREISDEPNAAAPMETQAAFAHVSMDEAHSLDQLSQTLLSNSLYDQTHFPALQNSADLPNGFVNCPVSDVKTEEPQFHLGFDSPPTSNTFFSGGDSVMIRFLQRSYSYGGHSYDGKKQGFLYQPTFSSLSESPENCFSNMRRICSAGDLSKMKNNQTAIQTVCSSHLGNESSNTSTFMEEANFKAARYSPEERKERIDRYRAKRTQRNFHKTIKYACRKTLADSRPRIRGRFARNDEPIETARPTNQYDDEDDLWYEGGDQREQLMVNHFGGSSQYCDQYIGY